MLRRPCLLIAVACVGAFSASAATAYGASLSITAPDEVIDGTTVAIHYSGDGSNSSVYQEPRLKVFAVPAGGGESCPDAGSYAGNQLSRSGTSVAKGPYAVDGSDRFDDPGVLRICASLFESGDTTSTGKVIASDSKLLAVRTPRLSLALSVPDGLQAPATFDLKAIASAEQSRDVVAAIIPDRGAGCPATASGLLSDPGNLATISQSVTGGPVTLTAGAQRVPAGHYLACGYFSKASSSSPPQLVAAPVAFEVAAAPPLPPPRPIDLRVKMVWRNPARVLRPGDRVKVYAFVKSTGKTEQNPTISVISLRGFKLRRAMTFKPCRMMCLIDGPLGTPSPAYSAAYYLTFVGGVSRPAFSVRVHTKLAETNLANNVATMRGDKRAKPLPKVRPDF